MEFWEFLIQQEGDRSWLPLESPSVEILEGRYRIVARSSRKNTATEVRVTHYATDADPPVRRVRKRSSQTNPEGLIVILPFTRLQPGLWELRCTGDLLAEMMGETWQYGMRLEVLPALADWEDDWPAGPALTDSQGETSQRGVSQDEPVETAAFAAEPPVTALLENGPFQSAPASAPVEQPLEAISEQPKAVISEPVTADPPESEAFEAAESTPPAVETAAAETASVETASVETTSVETTSAETTAAAAYLDELPPEWQDGSPAGPIDGSLLDSPAPASPVLQVHLDREVFVIQRGETLALTGRIELAPELQPQADQLPVVSELGVRLYDPQTSQLLMDEVYPIDNRVPPFPFSGTVSLPDHYQTYLVLGELVFRGPAASGELQVLATRSFNVTTDLHELIESVANDFLADEALPPEAQMPEAEPVPLAELNQLPSFRRSTQQPLPPQLRPHDPTRTHAKLDLPSFGSVSSPQPAISTSAADLLGPQSISSPAGQPDDEPVNQSASQPKAPEEAAQEPSLELATQIQSDEAELTAEQRQTQQAPIQQAEDQAALSPDTFSAAALNPDRDLFFEWSELDGPRPVWQRPLTPSTPLSNKPEDVSFRALNFQSRFWDRLQGLASRPELSAELADDLAELEPQTVRRTSGLDADLAAQEFVVEDGTRSLSSSLAEAGLLDAAAEVKAAEADLLSELVLPPDEPIPTPRLQLPTGELVAGQPILITVKLPNLQARVYVKLWLRDRQTRSLLGTPRWLIDFLPDGFGNQMARAEVIVPPGSLKVQFEAIAVEIATQRESDKVTTTRPIVPPDLSPLSLDRLEI